MALHRQREMRRATTRYRQGPPRDSDNADGLYLLGVLAEQEGRYEEALEYIGRAITIKGSDPSYYRSLAQILRCLDDLPAAIGCLREATCLCPADSGLHRLLGDVLRQWGDLAGAAASYSEALQRGPAAGALLRDLGDVVAIQGHLAQAAQIYEAAISLTPDDATLHNNRSAALRGLGRLDEARAECARTLSLAPDAAGVRLNTISLCQELCAWHSIEEQTALVRTAVAARPDGSTSPFMFLTIPSTGAEQLACARAWVSTRFPRAEEVSGPSWTLSSRRGPRERLHIGYLSPDFRDHVVSHVLAGVLERHDRSHLQVTAYSIGPDDHSVMRGRIARAVDHFVDMSAVPSATAVQRIRNDGVDILLDLTGYIGSPRTEILAGRAAPIQVNYLGYPGTMGAPFIDYMIADRFVIPSWHRAFYAERVAYLPDCYLPADSTRPIAERTPSRADCGLPDTGFVFCCFNHAFKITPPVFAIWMRLLRAVPGSVLWLKDTNHWASANLRGEAMRAGIDPARLLFASRLPLSEHLVRHQVADLFLDTLPYNAHATASDALWAGLPVVTCAGQTFASRVAGSLLRAVGLPELVTTSLEEYEALALVLARNPRWLATLRERLWTNRMTTPLFDTALYTRNLESLYRRMWEAFCHGSDEILASSALLTAVS